VADRPAQGDDGSPLRKPRALPVLVRHAPRASPRPWCLENGRLACRYSPALPRAGCVRAVSQATSASHSLYGGNSKPAHASRCRLTSVK
jgi:hypothetical protein